MSKRKRLKSAPPTPVLADARPVGRARYTVGRFLYLCSEPTREYLVNNWAEGNVLTSEEIPTDGLACVVILACYARQYGVEIVDDYVHLLDRYWEEIKEINHLDKFFASSIVILDETGRMPEEASFDTINIAAIYEELFP